jgi:hypothetical protein
MLSFLLPNSPETPALLLASTSQVCTFSLTSHPIFCCQIRGEKSPLLLLPLYLEKEEKRATREPRGLQRSAHEQCNPPEQMGKL